jgi:hypothetical protein
VIQGDNMTVAGEWFVVDQVARGRGPRAGNGVRILKADVLQWGRDPPPDE